MQDVEIKVCTHRFECDALKVAAIQTCGLISVMMGFISSTTFKQVFFFFLPLHYHNTPCINPAFCFLNQDTS